MSVFMLCERALGLIRGHRLELSASARVQLEALDYEGLAASHAQEEAVSCVRHFAAVRDSLLGTYPWVFARKSAPLAELSEAVVGWAFGYVLPVDCLKLLGLVVRVGGFAEGATLAQFEQVGRTVGCRYRVSEARYTARVTDTQVWDPVFCDVFCCRLAGEIGTAITGVANPMQMMEQRAQLFLQEAYRVGAIASTGEVPLDGFEWDGYVRG